MSRGTSSAKTLGSSFRDSMHDADSRARERVSSFRSLNIETSRHSYPKTTGNTPVTYGQQSSEALPYAHGVPPESGVPPTHSAMHHNMPAGSAQRSPFLAYGTDVSGYHLQPPGAVAPLPHSASFGYTASFQAQLPRPMYTTSGAYAVPNYAQRGYTTGSVPPGMQPMMPMPSGSYSTPYGHHPSRSTDRLSDDCFNIFWLFFLLGPLTWPCGMFGVCSDKSSERLAGVISGVCLILVIIAVVVVITTAPEDSESDSSQ